MAKLSEFIRVIFTAVGILLTLVVLFFLSSYQGDGLHRPWNWIVAIVAGLVGYRIVEKIYSIPNRRESSGTRKTLEEK